MLNLKPNPCIFSSTAHPRPEGHPHTLPEPRAQDARSAPCVHQLLPHWCPSRAGLQLPQPCPRQPWPDQAQPTRGPMTRPQAQGGAHTQGWGCPGAPQLPCSGLGVGCTLPAASLPSIRIPCHCRHLGHCGSLCVRADSYQAFICSFQSKEMNWKRFIHGGWGLQRWCLNYPLLPPPFPPDISLTLPASLTSSFHSISNAKSNCTSCSTNIRMHVKSKGKHAFTNNSLLQVG